MENNNININEQQLEDVNGGRLVPKRLRVTCSYCGHVFETDYYPVIQCPCCWYQMPIWQGEGYKVEVIEWLEK